MASKKKVATTAVALTTAAALLLGGTFAWQSISQRALNEASDVINPGGRLHNDMWYVSAEENNNDIYVENFAEEDIFARVRLEEYFEIVLNHDTPGEISVPIIGAKTEENGETTYTYERFTGYEDYATELQAGKEVGADGSETPYWTWKMGGETVYMPTFNMNKDSLLPDLNGIYEDGNVGTISNRVPADDPEHQYSDWTEWEVDQAKTANEIWDIDSNDIDELEALSFLELADVIEKGSNPNAEAVELVEETHTAKYTQDAQLVSMTEWMSQFDDGNGGYDASLYDPAVHGNYWVYDDTEGGDGWVYWSAKLGAHQTTGLLLDGTSLNQVMDDTWYYAINAVGQFCTPDDTGVGPDVAAVYNLRTASDTDTQLPAEGTGFYADGETVTPLAQEFLRILGMTDTTPGYDPEEPEEPEQSYSMQVQVYDPEIDLAYYLVPNKDYDIEVITDVNVSDYDDTAITLSVVHRDTGATLTEGEDYTITDATPKFEENSEGTGYVAKSCIKILNEELVSNFVQIKAVADTSGNTAINEISVQWVQKDILLTFYDESGVAVAGTNYGSTIAPNSEYDFSASIIDDDGNDYVIFSTLDSVPVSDRVLVEKADPWVSMNANLDVNYIEKDETGTPVKFVVGDAETFDNDESVTDSEGTVTDYDLLVFAFDVKNIKIYESAEEMASGAKHIVSYKAYGQWYLYPTGQEKYDIQLDGEPTVSQSDRMSTFTVIGGNDVDITGRDGLTVSLSGNSDEGTKIELIPATEGTTETPAQSAYYQLTIGENETATELTITASDSNGSGSKTVSLVYLDTLKIGDALSDKWNDIYIQSSNIATTAALSLVDYWGSEVEGVTYELVGSNTSEGTYVDGTTLHIGAEEQGWPMYLNVTVDDMTTEYYVYVNYVAPEEPSYNYTIGVTANSEYFNGTNAPLLSSNGTAGTLTLKLYADGVEAEGVTWNTGSSNLMISDNTISQAENVSMSGDMESYVVEALDSTGTKCAEMTVYLVNEVTYAPIGTVVSAETGVTYCAFDYVPYEGEETLGLVPKQICVYRIGDDVSKIYYCMETMNFNIADMADTFDTKYAENTMPLVSSIENWPVT